MKIRIKNLIYGIIYFIGCGISLYDILKLNEEYNLELEISDVLICLGSWWSYFIIEFCKYIFKL